MNEAGAVQGAQGLRRLPGDPQRRGDVEPGFALQLAPLLVALLSVPALTVITGLLMSRGALNQPPLAVLRSEV